MRTIVATILSLALLAPLTQSSSPHRASISQPTYCVNGSVPSGCIFGVYGTQYVVLSSFAYESGILPSHQPVGDYDYMTPGRQQTIKLPGGHWNTFIFIGATFVLGSGYVAQFCLVAGGCFDFLHLQYVRINGRIVSGAVRHGPPPTFKATGLSGDERTALVAERTLSPKLTGTRVHGGDVIGLSRWPDWSIYANGGGGGPLDAHLCVLMDRSALGFFWKVATGEDKKPPSFPLRRWQKRTRRVSAYRAHYLLAGPRYWWKHALWLGPVLSKRYFSNPSKHGSPYYRWVFVNGYMFTWPGHQSWRPRVVKRTPRS